MSKAREFYCHRTPGGYWMECRRNLENVCLCLYPRRRKAILVREVAPKPKRRFCGQENR